MDGRRRRWFAMPADWPFDSLGTRLLNDFGLPGIAVWSCVVAAAKRSHIEGTFSYTTDADAWQTLGLDPPDTFSLEDFFRLTGRLHETRKRRHGRVTTIELRRWDELQLTISRQLDAERKSRSRATNTRDIPVTDSDSDSDIASSSKGKAMIDETLYRLALAIAERNGARDPHAVALKIISEDSEQSIRARAAKPRESGHNPSPARNDPATCAHRAMDTEGWCAACSTQIVEVSA